MPNSWVVRTDFSNLENVILPSLAEGMLRQGWGYDDSQDLNVIGPLIQNAGRSELSDDQKATWRRVQRWWPKHWDPVSPGDRILLPKVPSIGKWSLVEVTGEYKFLRHEETGDHGHILPVSTIVAEISPTNIAVSASLQRTMRTASPMWCITRLDADLDRIIAAKEDVSEPNVPTDRLTRILQETRSALLPRIRDEFQANQLEEPVFRLLEQVYSGALVQKTAGPSEQGADFLITETDPLGLERRTVIQLKDHEHVLNDERALDQIRRAFDAYAPVSTAIVLTTAEHEDVEFGHRREQLASELGIPVEAVLGDQLATWFLSELDAIAGA